MSGNLWPIGLLMGRRTTKASRLSVGQFVKGKNGYVEHPTSPMVELCRERLTTPVVPEVRPVGWSGKGVDALS